MDDLISRQAAILSIEEYADRLQMVNWKENPGVPYKAHALNWAINTIRDLPSAERREVQSSECEYWDDESNFCTLNRPSAERHGRWIETLFGWRCSVCGEEQDYSVYFKHCPNCGAKMKGYFEEPEINPCRGCGDYDGKGGCISKGGCGAKMEDDEE